MSVKMLSARARQQSRRCTARHSEWSTTLSFLADSGRDEQRHHDGRRSKQSHIHRWYSVHVDAHCWNVCRAHVDFLGTRSGCYRPSFSSALSNRDRGYHSTSRQQILPLLFVGFVGVTAVYSYRAMQQMDRDWEEYQRQLQEYNNQTASHNSVSDFPRDNQASTGDTYNENNHNQLKEQDVSALFSEGILAIDMGTTALKLAHRPSLSQSVEAGQQQNAPPVVIVDREGFRSIPSVAWMNIDVPTSNNKDIHANDCQLLFGRLAAARMHDSKGGAIIRLQKALLSTADDKKEDSATMAASAISRRKEIIQRAVSEAIQSAALNALDQAFCSATRTKNNRQSMQPAPLFVLDASLTKEGSYNVRPIFTYPSPCDFGTALLMDDNTNTTDLYLQRYKSAIQNLPSPHFIASFVPEPIAIAAGAKYYNLLPEESVSSRDKPLLVVDVGGTTTWISIVSSDGNLLHSRSLPLGGDTFINLLVIQLIRDFYGSSGTDGDNAPIDIADATNDVLLKPTLNDPTALQRLFEASTTAIYELSRKTRTEINVPYLTMDIKTGQPLHLKVGVARSLIEAQIESFVRHRLVPFLQSNRSSPTILSKSLPPPIDLPTLFSSILTSALEKTSCTPQTLRAILFVGGGARIPLIRDALKRGVEFLAGDAFVNGKGGEGKGQKRLIIPDGEMGDELAVLGAAVWGSRVHL